MPNRLQSGSRSNNQNAAINRRNFLRLSGLGLSAWAMSAGGGPVEVLAQAAVEPRSTASACIFIKLTGAPSHMDTFSVKPGPWTPDDWNLDTQNNITLPRRLFPNILDRASRPLSIVHSLQGWWDLEHMRAEYRIDTGQEFIPALADERPAIGSVVDREYGPWRRPWDVLPTFVSLGGSPYGGRGFLEPSAGPFNIGAGWGHFPYRLIPAGGLSVPCAPETWDPDLASFYDALCREEPGVAGLFRYTDDERAGYGGTTFGDSCLMAGRLLAADLGARFIYITYGQYAWDHHYDVYPTLRRQAPALDLGLSALMEFLANTPSPEYPGLSLLDRTLVVAAGEFGRTPPSRYTTTGTGLSRNNGRDHYANVHFALLAGGGVIGGRNIGTLNNDGSAVTDPGWWGAGYPRAAGPNIRMEDLAVTIYSALGINWTREILDTPSGQRYQYVPGGPETEYKEVRELFE